MGPQPRPLQSLQTPYQLTWSAGPTKRPDNHRTPAPGPPGHRDQVLLRVARAFRRVPVSFDYYLPWLQAASARPRAIAPTGLAAADASLPVRDALPVAFAASGGVLLLVLHSQCALCHWSTLRRIQVAASRRRAPLVSTTSSSASS